MCPIPNDDKYKFPKKKNAKTTNKIKSKNSLAKTKTIYIYIYLINVFASNQQIKFKMTLFCCDWDVTNDNKGDSEAQRQHQLSRVFFIFSMLNFTQRNFFFFFIKSQKYIFVFALLL